MEKTQIQRELDEDLLKIHRARRAGAFDPADPEMRGTMARFTYNVQRAMSEGTLAGLRPETLQEIEALHDRLDAAMRQQRAGGGPRP